MTSWHRLFGMALTDLFTDSNYRVELETDLSVQQEFLDVLIIEQTEGLPLSPVPDGLEDLTPHNLLTYKSFQETLDSWALKELVGHYTTYRKLVSPDLNHLVPEDQFRLVPEDQFRLYAVSTRYPLNLDKRLTKCQAGVYEVECCHPLRVLVLSQFPETPNNAFWQLFSANAEKVSYGGQHYHWKQSQLSALLNQLFEYYHLEGIVMSYTVDDYVRDYTQEHLHCLTPAEQMRGLSPEQRLQGLLPEQRLQGLLPEQRLQGLSLEDLAEIEAYLSKLKGRPH